MEYERGIGGIAKLLMHDLEKTLSTFKRNKDDVKGGIIIVEMVAL